MTVDEFERTEQEKKAAYAKRTACDISTCLKGCPFWQMISHHGITSIIGNMYCARYLMSGKRLNKPCDLAERQAEFSNLGPKKPAFTIRVNSN